ncbi:phytoene desaturase family protein [Burkholderia sp. ISTR5]|uniref:phytoene desaturase family protein n=1 Tax=Burkholderia sp. ISTR5 TaxID=2500161 RepID=UPI001371F557|nr:NAD(P)/FAD-dependent oxidoreductase [Burkholderia sp. ISTR5]
MHPERRLRPAYDLVVIGAGPNGLSLALNLAEAGRRVLVVECGAAPGGQAVSEQALLPGFLLHRHANYLSYADLLRDQPQASSRAMRVPSVQPAAQHGLCFRDGRAPLVLYRRDHARRTLESLRRYSARDARSFERCKQLADGLTPALARLYFSVPDRAGWSAYLGDVSRRFGAMLDPGELAGLSARAVIDRLFEADEVRTLLYLVTTEFSVELEAPGGALGFLGYVLWLLGRRRLPLGGMGVVPRALAAAAERHGADFVFDARVARIVIEAGEARGVILADGRRIDAAMVASSLAYDATLGMLDEQDLPLAELATLARHERAEASLVGSYAACLRAAPSYRGGAVNRDIDACAQTFVGLDSTAEVLERERDLRAGRLPAPSGAVRLNSLWDAGQAPPGRHAAGADCAFPAGLDADFRAEIERVYPAAFAKVWAAYAPNLEVSIEAQALFLSGATQRRLVLREGAAQYRGPAKGLYCCGSSTYPGGGVHGACGINAGRVMLADAARAGTSAFIAE